MPNVWVEIPRKFPHRCFVSGRSKREDGPYFEFDVEYQDPQDHELAPRQLYISAKYLMLCFTKEGGPDASVVASADLELLQERIQDLETSNEELAAEVSTLTTSLDRQADVFAAARARKTPARTPRKTKAPVPE